MPRDSKEEKIKVKQLGWLVNAHLIKSYLMLLGLGADWLNAVARVSQISSSVTGKKGRLGSGFWV